MAGSKVASETPGEILERMGVGFIEPGRLEDWPKGADGATFIAFLAPWCEVSLEAAPILGRFASKLPQRAKFLQVDVDRASLDVERLGVRSVPAVVLYADRGEVARPVGLATEDDLVAFAERALGKIQ